MGFLRKSLLVILTPLLVVLLLATALDFGAWHVVGNSQDVKHLLADSGIYSNTVNSALLQAQNSTTNGNEISLTNPTIESAANSVFTPKLVQVDSEQVIDSIYNWLNDKAPQPNFSIDLSAQKSQFADKVAQAAQSRAANLPTCTSVPPSTDPLSVTCLPPGVTPTQVATQAKNDALNAQGFLENPVITAGNVKSQSSGQSVFDNQRVKQLPAQYQKAKKAPPALIALTILVVLGIIFLNATRRKGLRHAGVILATTGAFLLIFAWGLNRVMNHNVIPDIRLDNKVLRKDTQKLTADLTHDVDRNYWIFGGAYAAMGILAFVGATLIGRNRPAAAPQKISNTNSETHTRPIHKAPTATKKPPKIQG